MTDISIEIKIDILFDGPESEISELIALGVEYAYCAEVPEFFVGFGREAVSMHKCYDVPLCVELFGIEQNMKK